MVGTTISQTTSPLPQAVSIAHPRSGLSPNSTHSSASESASESEAPSRRSRMDRPRLGNRAKSSSIIVPKKEANATIQTTKPEYPPDDARAMSPRRNSEDLERLGKEMRESLKDQARTLQSSLAALAERIDEVKSDHDKLESENRFLQDYIGGLTRTMSKEHVGSSKKGKK